LSLLDFEDFRIAESVSGENCTRVTPDAAICAACRAEVLDPKERRYGYPFANCTHCGPRFSIVKEVPYDRANTTMADFPCAHPVPVNICSLPTAAFTRNRLPARPAGHRSGWNAWT